MADPHPTRPSMAPGYGIAADSEGMLAWSWVVERLERSRNYWICSVRADGRPHAIPVWGVWVSEAFWFGTNPASVKGRNLLRDPRVTVHLESGDECVILEGVVETLVEPDPEPYERMADAYERKYGGYRPQYPRGPGFFRLRPRVALAWTEAEYPKTATRWRFDHR